MSLYPIYLHAECKYRLIILCILVQSIIINNPIDRNNDKNNYRNNNKKNINSNSSYKSNHIELIIFECAKARCVPQ